MIEFTSSRERRLWIATAVVLIAIFSTLGVAQRLAGAVPAPVLQNAYWVGLWLTGGAILLQAIRRRTDGVGIGAIVGILGAYFIAFLRVFTPEERSHLIEYTVVALLIREALRERERGGRPVRHAGVIAIAVTTGIGILDETVQLFVPGRVFDPRDILFNFIAAVLAVVGDMVVRWARSRVRAT